jgi:hypothetical protein
VAGEGGVSARGFKKKGKRSRLSLGEYPTVSLQAARARAAANAYLDQAARGESPVVKRELAATTGGLTVRALGEKFLTDYVQTKELRRHVTPAGRSVFYDLFPKAEADELVMRSTLFRGLEQWLKESGLTQTQAAKALGITQAPGVRYQAR